MIEDRDDGAYEVVFADFDTRCTYEAYVSGAYEGTYDDIFQQTMVGDRKIELALKPAHRPQDEDGEDLGDAAKARIYVSSAADVPPGYMVQRGKKGGIYYESSRPSPSVQGWSGPKDPKQTLESIRQQTAEYQGEGRHNWGDIEKSLKLSEHVKYVSTAKGKKYGLDANLNIRDSIEDLRMVPLHEVEVLGTYKMYINAADPPSPAAIDTAVRSLLQKHQKYVEGRIMMPKIIFMGKSIEVTFDYKTRDGKARKGGVQADCDTHREPVVRFYDDPVNTCSDVMSHELGHALHAQLSGAYQLDNVFAMHGIQYLQHLKDQKLYDIIAQELWDLHGESGLLETYLEGYLKEPRDLIEEIKKKKGADYWYNQMPKEGLDLFNEGYNAMEAMQQRFRHQAMTGERTHDPRMTADEKRAFREAAEEYGASNPAMWNDWKKVWETEDWPTNEYGDRNPEEMFAEFYEHRINQMPKLENDLSTVTFNLDNYQKEYIEAFPTPESRDTHEAEVVRMGLRDSIYYSMELGMRHMLNEQNFDTFHKGKTALMDKVMPSSAKTRDATYRQLKRLFNRIYKDEVLTGPEEKRFWDGILAEYQLELEGMHKQRSERSANRAAAIAKGAMQ